MSSYSELIKSFEKIRAYMRDFYLYGFKSRDDFDKKSARSYDDERRRIESWLGDHMSFVRAPEGKNLFISIDSRSIRHNPLYKAWKAKSFTDGDVTLHFILFDILHDVKVSLPLSSIMELIDKKYLSGFDSPMMLDESTVRKKLKEYTAEGIIVSEKKGRKVYYRRAESVDISELNDVLHFYSEVAPCGVVGSFLLDKEHRDTEAFSFKHHYITSAIDSGVLASIFCAMREKRVISVTNISRKKDEPRVNRIIPLKVLVSVQSGRQHLLAYYPGFNSFPTYRIDYLSNVKLEEVSPRFDELRAQIDEMKGKMWGVSTKRNKWNRETLEHVSFTVKVADNEEFIVSRLEREKRIGSVEKIDANTYRFTADVYDTSELIPWIRTFICRITDLSFTNKTLETQFREDLDEMYKIYGIEEGCE